MAEIPTPVRFLILGFLSMAVIAGSILYFLSHGYSYEAPVSIGTEAASYSYSQHCMGTQTQKEQAEAPLRAEMEPIANKLIHADLPLENGQELYDRYDALRNQINAIETKYTCS